MEKQKVYDVHKLWMIYKPNKKWFMYSLLICLCIGLSYIYWTKPVYDVTGKIQIVDRKVNSSIYTTNTLQSQLPYSLGNSLSGSTSMETEKEIIKSRLIARDAVMDLGLYTEYRISKWLRSRLVYKNNPVNVTIGESTLKLMDEGLPMVSYVIRLSIDRDDEGYRVNGYVMENKNKTKLKEIVSASLPASISTSIGDLKLIENNNLTAKDWKRYAKGYHLDVTIVPPMTKARLLAKKMTVNPPSKKNSLILLIDFKDENILRGIDFVNAIVENYNKQSNEEKHKEAAKNDEFVNERLAKIDAELGISDDDLERFLESHRLTNTGAEVSEALGKRSGYENELISIETQLLLLGYLSDYVNDPANLFELIPVNVGVYVGDAVSMISRHNSLVTERNQILKGVSEQSPQGKRITQLIEELHPAIKTAMERDRQSLMLKRNVAQREFDKYISKVSDVPQQSRALTDIARQRNIKQSVYVSLLQKREENAMELVKNTDKGRLADATLFNKKVKPRTLIVLALALFIGILLPYIFIFVRRWLRGTINDSYDLEGLTHLSVIGEIPSEESITEEAFISIRSNLLHQMGTDKKIILVTSDTIGDGKTYIAIRLAGAIAKMGRKTLLCDLDFRNPSVARELHIQEEKGLCSILTGGDAKVGEVLESVRHSSLADTLDVLVPGRMPSIHPANLLAHENLIKALMLLKDNYDYIVLDTSAVGQYDDILIDGLEDVTCYVCRSGKTPKTAIYYLNTLDKEKRLIYPIIVVNNYRNK